MAKLLKKQTHTSSMSRFLDRDAVAGALAVIPEEPEVQAEAPRAPEPKPEAQQAPALRVVERRPEEGRAESRAVEEKKRPAAATQTQTLIRGGELYLTPHSAQILSELVGIFKEKTNRAIAPTHMLRGLLLALQAHLPEIRSEISAMGPLKRPANESQFALDREEFEKKLGEAILKAVKG